MLDESPQYVLAHSWSALIDASGAVTNLVEYPVATDAPRAPDRFRSMLFDGWGDDDGGVIRTKVLRQVAPYDSYHFADRVFIDRGRLARPVLPGPGLAVVPAPASPSRPGCNAACVTGARSWTRAGRIACGTRRFACMASTSWASCERSGARRCHRRTAGSATEILARWAASRVLPVAGRAISRSGLQVGESAVAAPADISVDALVAGREGRHS